MSEYSSKTRLWLGGALVFGLAVVIGLVLAPKEREDGPIPFASRPVVAESAPAEDEPASGLLELLATSEGEAAADTVMQAVVSDPKLKDRWAQMVQDNPNAKPGALLAEMADDKNFDQLLGKLKGDDKFKKQLQTAKAALGGGGGGQASGSSSAFFADVRRPADGARGSTSSRALAAAGSSRVMMSGAGKGVGGRSSLAQDLRARGLLVSGGATSGAVLSASAGPSAPGSSSPQRAGLGASAASSVVVDGAGSGPGAGPAAPGPGGPGANAPDVPPGFAPPVDPISARMKKLLEDYPFLAALTEDERRRLLEHIDGDGLWGACFRLDLYDRCAAACQGAGSKCQLVSRWDSCLQFKSNDNNACLDLCSKQRGCVPPMRVTCDKCGGVLEGGKCNKKDFCEYPLYNFRSFYDCLKQYGGHSCSGTKLCKNCCGPAGGGAGPGYDRFTVWCDLPSEGGAGGGPAPAAAGSCKYAGKTCEQICSPFVSQGVFPGTSAQCRNGGDPAGGLGSCERYTRSCPSDSACDPSVRQSPGQSASLSSRPCR